MKIAILGGGFSGLATCWHLLHHNASVTLFDGTEIGKGTSGLSNGLLHPYAGAHAKFNWQGEAGMKAAKELLEVASSALGRKIARYTGILRLAVKESQKMHFARCASQHADVEWWEAERCAEEVPGIVPHPGIFIRDGISINSALYLEGLWKACAVKGAQLEKRAVSSLEALASFDKVVVATGISASQFKELAHLKLTPIKGQIVELSWPHNVPPPRFPVSSDKYLIMNEDNTSCFLGGTYEREFESVAPEPEKALKELLASVSPWFPSVTQGRFIGCRAGIRAASPSPHLPIVGKVNERCWVFTGMGSKGLLYHGWLAKCLSEAILSNDESFLPTETHGERLRPM